MGKLVTTKPLRIGGKNKMERAEEIRKWKHKIIEDVNVLQKKMGIKNENIEKLKAEFIIEKDGLKITQLKNKIYDEIYKQNRPEIILKVTAAKLAKDGSIISCLNIKIENVLEDTQIIKDTEQLCKETGRQLNFYLVKLREKYMNYEELDKIDVTDIVQNYIKTKSEKKHNSETNT